MADEKWADIHGKRHEYKTSGKRIDTPRVNKPTCEEHCSGKHKPEGIIQCNKCQTVGYVVIAHEWNTSDGHYFYSLDPRNGAPLPAMDDCPCGGRFTRVL
jgi:hypothetical protein